MRYIKFLISETFSEYKKTPLLTFTAFFTVTVCFFSIFVSLRVLEKNAVVYRDINEEKRTYSDITASSESYSGAADRLEKSAAALISELKVSIFNCSFRYNEQDIRLHLEGFGDIYGIDIHPAAEEGQFIQLDNKISEGRGFTEDEIKEGKAVLVAEKGLIYSGIPVSTGDRIRLCGSEFKVVGIGSFSSAPFGSLIPLNGAASFSAEKITLAEEAGSKQYSRLAELLKTDEKLITDYERSEDKNSRIYTDQLLIAVMIAALGGVITVTLIKQIIREQLSRIALLKICGCKSGTVRVLLLTEIVFYALFSFAAAALCFKACSGILERFYLKNDVSFRLQLQVFVIMLVLIAAFNLPSVIKASNIRPSQIKVRR